MKRALNNSMPLGQVIKKYSNFYEINCEFHSEAKERHYEILGEKLSRFPGSHFKELKMVGLPEYRAPLILQSIIRGGLRTEIRGYLGFELDFKKCRKMARHYAKISKILPFPITVHQGDILEELPGSICRQMDLFKNRSNFSPNVFDFDFCQDTTAFKSDRELVKRDFDLVPGYKDHVPDLILASNIRRCLLNVIEPKQVFAVGVNFSARNVSAEAAEKFRDRIVKEFADPFRVHKNVPTAYRPSRYGSGMVGAWLILEKTEA